MLNTTVTSRVQHLMDCVLPNPHTHRLCNIPRFAGWGADGHFTFLSGRGAPIRITVIGCIVNKYVLPRTRSRGGQSGLQVDFVRDVDYLCMTRLLRHARPEPSSYRCCCQYVSALISLQNSGVSSYAHGLQTYGLSIGASPRYLTLVPGNGRSPGRSYSPTYTTPGPVYRRRMG